MDSNPDICVTSADKVDIFRSGDVKAPREITHDLGSGGVGPLDSLVASSIVEPAGDRQVRNMVHKFFINTMDLEPVDKAKAERYVDGIEAMNTAMSLTSVARTKNPETALERLHLAADMQPLIHQTLVNTGTSVEQPVVGLQTPKTYSIFEEGEMPCDYRSESGYIQHEWELVPTYNLAIRRLLIAWDTAWTDLPWHEPNSQPRYEDDESSFSFLKADHRDLVWVLVDPPVTNKLAETTENAESCLLSLLRQGAYPKHPLKTGEIRILTLETGSWYAPIRCSLNALSLSDAQRQGYTALSYVWGLPNQPHHIIWVNGQPIVVGRNLFVALAHFRPMEGNAPARYWIDALCIRQDDLIEKSAQLPLMGDIYSLASSVEIWLGLDEDGSQDAIKAIRSHDLYAQLQPKFTKALTKLIQRPWFFRLWIVQELVLARPAATWVYSGICYVAWDLFANTVSSHKLVRPSVYRGLPGQVKTSWDDIEMHLADIDAAAVSMDFSRAKVRTPIFTLYELRNNWRAIKDKFDRLKEVIPPNLRFVLTATRPSMATDPRDKVYGLLGMVDPVSRRELRPSYTKSLETVFMDTTLRLIMEFGQNSVYFTFPTLPNSTTERETGRRAPSWVIDFSYCGLGFTERNLAPPDIFSLAAMTRPGHISVNVGERTITVFASFLGTITDIEDHDTTGELSSTETNVKIPWNPASKWESVANLTANSASLGDDLGRPYHKAESALRIFLYNARKHHVAATQRGRWWAPNGIEPLWRTLLGGTFANSDSVKLSPAELQHKLDILAGDAALPEILPPGFSALPNEHEPFRESRLRDTLAEPLGTDIKKTISPVGVPRAKASLFVTDDGLCGLSLAGAAKAGHQVAVLFRGIGQDIPFVVEEVDGGGAFALVSVAYVPANWADLASARGTLARPERIEIT